MEWLVNGVYLVVAVLGWYLARRGRRDNSAAPRDPHEPFCPRSRLGRHGAQVRCHARCRHLPKNALCQCDDECPTDSGGLCFTLVCTIHELCLPHHK